MLRISPLRMIATSSPAKATAAIITMAYSAVTAPRSSASSSRGIDGLLRPEEPRHLTVLRWLSRSVALLRRWAMGNGGVHAECTHERGAAEALPPVERPSPVVGRSTAATGGRGSAAFAAGGPVACVPGTGVRCRATMVLLSTGTAPVNTGATMLRCSSRERGRGRRV